MSIETDYAILRQILAKIDARGFVNGWAAEFGVYSGYSLVIIAEKIPVIGFDSFEGLPEDWRPGFPKGTFATGGDEALYLPSPMYNAMLVKGLFSETARYFTFPPLSLVHIDCDLYGSTVDALHGVYPYLGVGTYVVFDEYQGYAGWEQHEAKAWEEFCGGFGIEVEEVARGIEERAFQITRLS